MWQCVQEIFEHEGLAEAKLRWLTAHKEYLNLIVMLLGLVEGLCPRVFSEFCALMLCLAGVFVLVMVRVARDIEELFMRCQR